MTALTEASQPDTRMGRGVVLVVEDDDDIRALVTRRLRRAGYRVLGVATGEEAVAEMVDGPQAFSALVVDILLPGIDGWEVARRARAVCASLPIVVASILDQTDLPPWLDNATSITKPLARGSIERAVAAVVGPTPASEPAPESGEADVARVLVVDDDITIREMVALKLGRLGLEVHTEADGEAGLAAVRGLRPHVVLLDWMMPKMTGLEVCAAVRATDGLEGTHLILLTANAQEADVARGLAAGADEYIVKPFSPREMADRVTAALASAAAGRPEPG